MGVSVWVYPFICQSHVICCVFVLLSWFQLLLSVFFHSVWLKGQKCGYQGAKGPRLFSTHCVAFCKHLEFITFKAMTHNQINHMLNDTTNCAFRSEGHFWPDYYSLCDESGFYRRSLLSQPCRILPCESEIPLLCLSCSSFAMG